MNKNKWQSKELKPLNVTNTEYKIDLTRKVIVRTGTYYINGNKLELNEGDIITWRDGFIRVNDDAICKYTNRVRIWKL